MNPIPEVKPFNLAEASRRNADFLVTYLTIAMGGGTARRGAEPRDQQEADRAPDRLRAGTRRDQAPVRSPRGIAAPSHAARWHSGRGGVVRGLLVARGAGSVAVRDVHAGGQGAAGTAAVR